MGSKRFWLSRTAGGVVAGVVMAGAGAGVAVAGAAGNSDQYTKGAKPYAGVQPHDVTVGTQTFASSVTTTISNTTVTQPYAVSVPYVPQSTVDALVAAVAALKANAATINTLLKPDLRQLLEPGANLLKTPSLAKTKKIFLPFTSPGSGKLAVTWKVGLPHKKGVYYINYKGTLHKIGDIKITLPTTSAGRTLLAKAKTKRVNVAAVVTYTATSGGSVKVSRNYRTTG